MIIYDRTPRCRRPRRIRQSYAPTLSITTFQAAEGTVGLVPGPPLLASPPPLHSSRLIYLEDSRHCTPSAYVGRFLPVFAIPRLQSRSTSPLSHTRPLAGR